MGWYWDYRKRKYVWDPYYRSRNMDYNTGSYKQNRYYSSMSSDPRTKYYQMKDLHNVNSSKPVVYLIPGMGMFNQDRASLRKLEDIYEENGYEVKWVSWEGDNPLWDRSLTTSKSQAAFYVWGEMEKEYKRDIAQGRNVTVIGHSNGARAVNVLANQGKLDGSTNYAINSGFDGKTAQNVTHVKERGDWLSYFDFMSAEDYNRTVWLNKQAGSAHSISQAEEDYFSTQANYRVDQPSYEGGLGVNNPVFRNYNENQWSAPTWDQETGRWIV